jgi:hypothetical protein
VRRDAFQACVARPQAAQISGVFSMAAPVISCGAFLFCSAMLTIPLSNLAEHQARQCDGMIIAF